MFDKTSVKKICHETLIETMFALRGILLGLKDKII